MKTTGDIILDRTLDKIGGKGLFVQELEAALRAGRVDLAVHSCKDLPMDLPEDLPLAAFSRREDPRDALVLPLGVGAAVYLTEYARGGRWVGAIEFAAETLSGLPSILFGLVGMLFFVRLLGFGTGTLAGGLTLVVMILPVVMRTTQESLKTVPQSYREGALGLGAGQWRMVRTVVLVPAPLWIKNSLIYF